MPCAGVVLDMIPTGFVRVADVFRPLSHERTRDVSVKNEIAVKKGPKRVFVGFGPPPLGFEAVYWESVYCGDAASACPPGLP